VSSPSITFFKVGKGNFTLIAMETVNIVVDINGTDEKSSLEILEPFLREEGDKLCLDVLCITHGDSDHCGGFAEFKEKIDEGELVIGEIWHPNYDRTLVTEDLPDDYLALHDEIPRRREIDASGYGDVEVPLTAWDTEDNAFSVVEEPDEFAMKVLSPYIKDEGDTDWNVNDVSLILNLEVLGLNILFPGDSGVRTWQERVIPYTLSKEEMEDWADAEILIASHHGSYSFFGKTGEEVLNADPHPDNYEALDFVEPEHLLVLGAKRFPTSRDQSGDEPPHYSAYKWYHKWFRENRSVSENDKHPDAFKYTADGHIRLEHGDDGWNWVDDWSPNDGGGNGKGFVYRGGETRRGGGRYA